MPKVKFEVVVDGNKTQPWSGVFKNDKLADEWYKKHGSFWRARGRMFVKVYER